MQITVGFVIPNPIDLTEPQRAAALFRLIYDLTERVGPFGEFRIELSGVECLGEYEVIEPGQRVDIRIAFLGHGPPGRPNITEDGRLGVHYELEFETVTLDDGMIVGSA
jgi:hypothetical protein